MIQQRFPKGWDEHRVQQLIAELDARTDEEWIAADEAAAADNTNSCELPVLSLAGEGNCPHMRDRKSADGAVANLVRSGRKQPQRFRAGSSASTSFFVWEFALTLPA